MKPTRTARWVLPLAAYKLFVLALIFCSTRLLPIDFSVDNFDHNYRWPPNAMPDVSTLYKTWDAQQYLFLSQAPYPKDALPTAMYPLWPLLIRLATPLFFGHRLVAALAAANGCSLAALLVVHHWATLRFGSRVAEGTVLLLLAFPGALFLELPYSESLFLLLVATLFLGLHLDSPWTIATAAVLMPLTRAVGVFCVVPIVVAFAGRGVPWRRYWLLLAPVAGYLTYLAILWRDTGDAFAGYRAQHLYKDGGSFGRLLHPMGFVAALAEAPVFHAATHSGIDRVVFGLFVLLLAPLWRLDKAGFWFALSVGLVSAVSLSLMSFTRFFEVLLPLFVAAAFHLRGRRRVWLWPTTAACFAVQVVLLLRHVNSYWAG